MYRKASVITSLLLASLSAGLTANAQDTAATIESLPAVADLPAIPKLPSPFEFRDGTPVSSSADWDRRQAEISQLVQKYIYGTLPPKPSSVTGSFSDERLTIECTEGDKSISFAVRIEYPDSGEAPYPAIIGIGGMTLPRSLMNELGIAVISFPNGEIGNQGGRRDRGKGKFYDLYGSDHSAGSLMAWAWGVGRVIDALETTPDAKINPTKLGVTGCSRNGKGALVCGAFNDRIALTIPTESGAGGASSWRVADSMKAGGQNVQTASQIVQENTWMAPLFAQFGRQVDRLPVDQHLVAALCAPRPLLITGNNSFEWLGLQSCYINAVATHTVWEALGVPDRMGFVQTSHSDHCSFKEIDELRAFCVKYLFDGEADTAFIKTDGEFDKDTSEWITWETPELK